MLSLKNTERIHLRVNVILRQGFRICTKHTPEFNKLHATIRFELIFEKLNVEKQKIGIQNSAEWFVIAKQRSLAKQ